MTDLNKLARDRLGSGYVLFGGGEAFQVVIGAPGGETYESRTAKSWSEAEKIASDMVKKHYAEQPEAPADEPKDDAFDPSLNPMQTGAKRTDGKTGDPREDLQSRRDAQPKDQSGRPSGSAGSGKQS